MASVPRQKPAQDPDLDRPIRELIAEVIPEPWVWMDLPNENLGGKRPNELIGTEQEEIVRNLVRAVKQGMFS